MLKPSLLIALLSFGTVLQGDHLTTNNNQSECCDPGPRHMRAAVRHIEAGGVGYNKGYSTLEAFFAIDPNQWRVMPFLDLRGHVFNDGKMAANAGIGARSTRGSRVYGINAYYDYRNTHHRGYNQVSMGLETLGILWDLRFNGYLPVGGKVSHPYNVAFAGFSGNSILVNRKFQYAMKGIDAEAGFHFGKTSDFDFYGAAGPYYFKGEMGKGAIGGKLRIAGYYKEYVTLELSDSFDNVFHNNVQGQLTLTLPFGPKTKPKAPSNMCPNTCGFDTTLAARMIQPVARQEIVVVDTHTKKNAASDFVIFVDNKSHSAGTFNSPYATLADAEANSGPGNIIYVFAGDGTTSGMSNGITLKDNQKFWGSGVGHTLSTNLGTIFIPPYTLNSPEITNTSGNAINLAANNEISGFLITNPNQSGIFGNNPGNLSILSSTIFYASGASSTYLTANGNSQNNVTIIDSSFLNAATGTGIRVETIDSSMINISVNNSIFSGNDYGAFLYALTSSSINGQFVNNSIVDSTSAGIYMEADDSASGTISVSDTFFSGNDTPVDFEMYDTAHLNVNLTNNMFVNNDNYLYFYGNSSNMSTPMVFTLDGNLITGTANNSIYSEFGLATVVHFTMVNNNLNNNQFNPQFVFNNTLDSTFVLSNNQFNHTPNSLGFLLQKSAPGLLAATFTDNIFQNNMGVGCEVFTNDPAATICLTMTGNTSSDNSSFPYLLNNMAGAIKVSPCNAADLNISELFDHNAGVIDRVESCPSGSACPP